MLNETAAFLMRALQTETDRKTFLGLLRGEDGVFVGGIAYHLRTPELAPGETRTLEAGHFTAKAVVVRITKVEP